MKYRVSGHSANVIDKFNSFDQALQAIIATTIETTFQIAAGRRQERTLVLFADPENERIAPYSITVHIDPGAQAHER